MDEQDTVPILVASESEKRAVPLLCRIYLHSWSKWEEYREEYHFDSATRTISLRRTCIKCGWLDTKSVYIC